MRDVPSSCRNLTVVLERFPTSCEALIASPPDRLKQILRRAAANALWKMTTQAFVGALIRLCSVRNITVFPPATETVTLISEVPRVLTDVPETWRMKASRPSKLELAWYENPGPLTVTCPDLGGEVNFTPSILITP